MGRNMAARLIGGYGGDMRFFDVVPANMADIPAQARASSLVSLAKDCDIIVTMLPATSHVKTALGENLFPHAKKGSLFIDCSTIDPTASKQLSADAAAMGHCFIDAPVRLSLLFYHRASSL